MLLWSMLSYGVKLWGWMEMEKEENMHEKYLRWVMGVSWNCPGYMLREKIEREKMRVIQYKIIKKI